MPSAEEVSPISETAVGEPMALARTQAVLLSDTLDTFKTSSAARLVNTDSTRLGESLAFEERYVVRRALGKGGMGEVMLCRDEIVGREVALKYIRPELAANDQIKARFLREARVQGQLEHPDIVPVYDLGVGPDGQVFFTMKRVRGRTLKQVIELLKEGDPDVTKEMTRRKLLSVMSSICLAVDFAHKRGVLHRDLKPANIMLGDFGEVYLLDWGIAKFIGDEEEAPAHRERAHTLVSAGSAGSTESTESTDFEDEDTVLAPESQSPVASLRRAEPIETALGEMYGTPGYMSPEQIDGLSRVTARSDIYGLGAILFELLSLEPLHIGETPNDMLAGTLRDIDARPSARAPDRELPPELDLVCQKATTKDANKRFASAREMSEAIERYLDGDRNLQLRKDMAETHAQGAEKLLLDALSAGAGSRQARAEAMREVGRALALDPTNESATRSMVRLLTEPPKEMPPEAAEAMLRSTQAQDRLTAFGAIVPYLGTALLYVALILWLGLRDPWWMAVTISGFTMAALLSYLDSKSTGTRYEWWVLASSLVGMAGCSRMLGPLILLPTFALGNTMGFALTPRKRRRLLFIAAGCLAFLLPAAAEHLGLLPASYQFKDGLMMVLPQMHDLPAGPTLVAIIVISVMSTIGAAVFVGETRDALVTAERKLHLHAWQLRQMLPQSGEGEEQVVLSTDGIHEDGRTIPPAGA